MNASAAQLPRVSALQKVVHICIDRKQSRFERVKVQAQEVRSGVRWWWWVVSAGEVEVVGARITTRHVKVMKCAATHT